ncbi:hypothetical protein [Porphyromonas macacae]|uniref:Uncharacterized protein n=1 Tax=Porphyromonas macacae TaxID=28115 RepID=A0A379DIZ1_9PORP|nr:hypothetical protein [Porphyromonas macacae]SUB78338.1 Uncharacterised protein [Porphyromonas macacae]
MNEKDLRIKDSKESMKHYSVPENYFDDLVDNIMNTLPEEPGMVHTEDTPVKISLFMRLKPVLYMAAAFIFTLGAFQLLKWQSNRLSVHEDNRVVLRAGAESSVNLDSLYMEYFYDQCSELVSEELNLSDL